MQANPVHNTGMRIDIIYDHIVLSHQSIYRGKDALITKIE